MPIGDRTARREKHLAERAGRELGQAPCELDRRAVGVAARTERQHVELRLDGGDDTRMPVAKLVDAVAVKIEDAAAADVDKLGAAGAIEHIEAGGRERLVEEIARILVEQRTGGADRAGRARLCAPARD